MLSLCWFFISSPPLNVSASQGSVLFSSTLRIPQSPSWWSHLVSGIHTSPMCICRYAQMSLQAWASPLHSWLVSYCLLQVRRQVDKRSMQGMFNVSNLTCLTQTPDLPPDLLLPASYPSQFWSAGFQLPRPKYVELFPSPLFFFYSIANPHQNWFLPSKYIQSLTISQPLHHSHPRLLQQPPNWGPCPPASPLDITPTSTHSVFSISKGLCNNVSQIMPFLCSKSLKVFLARTMPKG